MAMGFACWPLLAGAQAGLSDPPGPAAAADGCHAFVIGPCVRRAGRPSMQPVAAARSTAATRVDGAQAASVIGTAVETDIDRYVAEHGKPPREVARALLDPTDQNIAAMMRRLQRDQALAAYVGQRMTELAQTDPSLLGTNGAAADLPALSGLRLVLVTQPGCEACDRAAQVLQQLVATYPTLDARVAVAGARDARHIVQEMARSGVTLPTAAAADALLARIGRSPPYLLVADPRREREAVVPSVVDGAQLRQALLAFRREAPTRPPPSRE